MSRLSRIVEEAAEQVRAMSNDTLLSTLELLMEETKAMPEDADLARVGGTAMYRAMCAAENVRRLDAGLYDVASDNPA